MKKLTRRLFCLLTVILLVACMTVPAMADSRSGTGTYENYTYNWTVTCTVEKGFAHISTPYAPAYVKSQLTIDVHDAVAKKDYSKVSLVSTGYASCYSELSGGEGCVVRSATGHFWVNGYKVLPNA